MQANASIRMNEKKDKTGYYMLNSLKVEQSFT